MAWTTVSKTESDYYEEIDELAIIKEKDDYANRFDGSYELSRGDYEGAILAAEEFNSGRIS